MPRTYKRIECSKTDIIILHEMSTDTSNPRLALRAQMVLQCIEGRQVKDIAAELGERPNTVILWRNRFAEGGVDGLANLPRGDSANKYGGDLKQRIYDKLNSHPPDGSTRWTGNSLSKELGVPPDVIWRCLRKEKIKLSDITVTLDDNSAHPIEDIYDIPLELHVRKDVAMNSKLVNSVDIENPNADESMDLVIAARIEGKDGTVIEKEIRLSDALPNVKDFDLSTKEGFLRDFDQLEKSMLAARNRVTEGIAKEYLDVASKKNRTRKKA